MARPFHLCPHLGDAIETGTEILVSTIAIEAAPGGTFHRKYAFPETAGCAECRAKQGYVKEYFAIPLGEDQDIVEALLAAAARLNTKR